MRKFFAVALVLALTGCAAETPAPSITPVNLKYCALSDATGFDDDGLNRSVYAALQQLKVQTGAAVMAIETSAELDPAAGIQKLVEANCDAVITSGDELVAATLAAAKQNSKLKFYAVSDILNTGESAENFTAITFNIYQAAYAAGFLAAAETENSAEIGVLNLINDFASRKVVKAFTAGVGRFNTEKRSRVKLAAISKLQNATQEVVFAVAGNSSQFGVVDKTTVKLIGFGRDWYEDARNKNLQANILTSVVRIDVIGKVANAITSGTGSVNYDLTNQGVGLAPAYDLVFPAAFSGELDQIVKDFVDGKVKVG